MPRTAATPRGRILAVAAPPPPWPEPAPPPPTPRRPPLYPRPWVIFDTASLQHVLLPPCHFPSPLAPGTGTHGMAVTSSPLQARRDPPLGLPRDSAKAAAKPTGHRQDQREAGRQDRSEGHSPARHAEQHAARVLAKPYQMYDSVTPSAIPGGKAVATYADGPYAASPAAVAGHHVTWIDTNGSDPAGATVLDVEPGDATPAGAAAWAAQRLDTHPHATAVIYTMRSEWAAAQTSIAGLPHWQQHHVRWWIADPTGTPHVVPGSNATQWYWGTHYDISTVNPGF